jgi:uncharacterized membrane protein
MNGANDEEFEIAFERGVTMKVSRQDLVRWWTNWAAPVMIVTFIVIAIFLNFRQHAAFQTGLDLSSYTHLFWNISQGGGFVTLPGPTNYLTNHFSLLLLLIAPVFSLWPDTRTLMVVQSIALTITIIPAYLILRKRYPLLAPLLVLAFVLSPLLQQTIVTDFHGIMLAAPFLAWAFYALYTRHTRLLFITLGLALLAREDVGLFVASFGLFIFIFHKGQRLIGLALMVLGGLWVIVVINWVMPSFGIAYHHFGFFSSLGGNSLGEMAGNVIHDPLRLVSALFTTSKLKAFLRFIAPLAFLPLVALGYPLLWLPMVLVYLISNASGSGLLDAWRLAPFLPLLWASIAVLLVRLRPRWAGGAMAVLLVATIVGFLTLSPFPGGGKFNPTLYQVNEHTQIGEQIVASIPPDAAYVVAQDGLTPHLAKRPELRLFPLYSSARPPDLIVVDEKTSNLYPLSPDEFKSVLVNMKTDPGLDIIQEHDGYFVFEPSAGTHKFSQPISVTWSSLLRLYEFAVTQSSQGGSFEPISSGVDSGSTLRVELYWTALQAMSDYYAISVRLLAPDGSVVAQDDNWPASGAVPTPLWEAGRSLRDMHYLQLPETPLPSEMTLSVVVYNADTIQPIEPAEGAVLTKLPAK